MATHSNRPDTNASESNPPELSLDDASNVTDDSNLLKDAQSAEYQQDDQSSHSDPSQLSNTLSAQPPTVSSSQPHFSALNTFDASSIRRTTPTRMNSSTASSMASAKASSKKSPQKGAFSNSKASNSKVKHVQSRNQNKKQIRNVQVRIPLFFGVGIGLSLLAAGLKAIAAALAEGYLYSLPWVGGFLRSVELSEISNLLVFALLAVGIGAATIWLPRRWNPWAKVGLLLIVSPFVFSASYLMQQRLWIQRVAERANIPYREAEQVTDGFLERQTGSRGFFGFYAYSTEVAEMPTSRTSLERSSSSNPSQALTRELASYEDPRADLVAYVFERVGWLLRLMYMAIAAFTALIYYFKGLEWADEKQTANYERRTTGAQNNR